MDRPYLTRPTPYAQRLLTPHPKPKDSQGIACNLKLRRFLRRSDLSCATINATVSFLDRLCSSSTLFAFPRFANSVLKFSIPEPGYVFCMGHTECCLCSPNPYPPWIQCRLLQFSSKRLVSMEQNDNTLKADCLTQLSFSYIPITNGALRKTCIHQLTINY